MLTRLPLLVGLAVVAGLTFVSATATPASADVTCEVFDFDAGVCEVYASVPGTGPAPADPVAGPSGPVAPRVCTRDYLGVHELDCETRFGSWSQSRECYVAPVTPPPAASDPVWQGNTTGAIYRCTGADRVGDVPVYDFWSPEPPTDVDPAVVAQQAIAQMQLRAVDIATSPGQMGYVNLPTWFWAATPSEGTTGPRIERTATAGGVTVTAVAALEKVVWQTGEGSVTCTGPGRPWTPSDGADEPECGWTYGRASVDGPYEITATSHWLVTWQGAGQQGEIPLQFVAETALPVAEVQAIVTR